MSRPFRSVRAKRRPVPGPLHLLDVRTQRPACDRSGATASGSIRSTLRVEDVTCPACRP